MRSPLNYMGVTQKFSSKHKGIDLGWNSKYGGTNVPVMATWDGEVVYYKNQVNSGGYVVGIYHKELNVTSEYGHLRKGSVVVKVGDKVKTGQQIAIMGNSGKQNGKTLPYHLHYGLQKGKGLKYGILAQWLDPIKYLNIYDGQTANVSTSKLINHTKKVIPSVGVNIRNKPNIKGKVIYVAKHNTQVENHGLKNGWNIVDNIRGYYCSNEYVK